jgi:pimeloyl-ACP methyl ester carboxylesterase
LTKAVPLLLIHAFPVDSSMWKPQTAAISGRKVLAPDLPGFGSASLTEPELTMRAAAKACIEAMDAAAADKAVLCGLSMGGYVAFEIWRRYGNRVAGLILANTRADPDDEARATARRELASRLRAEGSQFLVENPPPLLSAHAPAQIVARVRELIAAQPAASIAAAAVGMANRVDSRPDLASIDVPVLVITSDEDSLIPAEISAPMADEIPDARLGIIAGAGHLSNMEKPGEFNGLVAEHAKRCDS